MEKPQPGSSPSTVPSTTYVHADATSFREVVQRLTGPMDAGGGSSLRSPSPPSNGAPRGTLRSPSPTSRVAGVKRPPLGLQDRRQCPPRPPALVIPKPAGLQAFSEAGGSSSRGSAATSPSVASPSPPSRSPLTSPSTNMANLSLGEREGASSGAAAGDEATAGAELNEEEEEKAIKAKRFYLHPSPRSGQKKMLEPELLPLFPTSTTASPAESP